MTHLNRVEFLRAGVMQYAHANGLPMPSVDFSTVVACPDRGRQIAAAYEAAPTFDSAAIPAYRAFSQETVRQFELLTRPTHRGGLGVEIVVWSRDPYPGAAAMMDELRHRRRLRIYSTEACANPHPYLSDHENDMFRAVHDAFGHAATGCGFDADGEEAAWLAHSHMYSPLARRALTTETRGQQKRDAAWQAGWVPAAEALPAASRVRRAELRDVPVIAVRNVPLALRPVTVHRPAPAGIRHRTRTALGYLRQCCPPALHCVLYSGSRLPIGVVNNTIAEPLCLQLDL